jgi:hypothetical protein
LSYLRRGYYVLVVGAFFSHDDAVAIVEIPLPRSFHAASGVSWACGATTSSWIDAGHPQLSHDDTSLRACFCPQSNSCAARTIRLWQNTPSPTLLANPLDLRKKQRDKRKTHFNPEIVPSIPARNPGPLGHSSSPPGEGEPRPGWVDRNRMCRSWSIHFDVPDGSCC